VNANMNRSDLVIREGSFRENGYFTVPVKPGYGCEINPGVARVRLATGESRCG
jgi:hypothetical protein